MENKPNVNVKEALEKAEDLSKLLTERIADLHEVKGMMQARHAYIFYRKVLWEIRDSLTPNP